MIDVGSIVSRWRAALQSPKGHAPWDVALPAIARGLQERSVRPVHFIDAAFPMHVAHALIGPSTLAFIADSSHRRRFAMRFRAAGGLAPLQTLEASLSHPGSEGPAGNPSQWLYLGSAELGSQVLECAARAGARVIAASDRVDQAERDGPLADRKSWARLDFALEDGRASGFSALLPATVVAQEHRLLAGARRAPERRGLLGRRASAQAAERDHHVLLVSAGELAGELRQRAGALVTDNAYASETIGSHSWMWTGATTRSRFALGRVPAQVAKVKVYLSANPLHRSIDGNLVFEVNGATVAHDLELRPDGSGSATIPCPDGPDADCIVGVGCRSQQRVAADGRALGVCIDSMAFVS